YVPEPSHGRHSGLHHGAYVGCTAFHITLKRKSTAEGGCATRASLRSTYLPVYVTRQMDFEPSSLTNNAPSLPTATPTGRPQTFPSLVTKPVRKSSYSPAARPFLSGTRITSYPVRRLRFQEPCSEAKISPRYSGGNCFPS